ncbi:Transketolase [Taenia solium]|eukprot:TsM_000587600 transcript=TsM_000587600 gene=TsM_000587600
MNQPIIYSSLRVFTTSGAHCLVADMADKIALLKDAATRLRINSIKATEAAKSGHPTSCSSIAEVMAVLFLDEMKYFVYQPRHPSNDRFVLSKGHAAPVLYAAWAEAGLLSELELLNLRKIDSDLEGHPTPRLNFVDVATGSLGQGLSNAAGMAYTGKYIDKAKYRVYCIIGDGESAEGSIWEALSFSSYYKLDNLVTIFDVNRLGQSQPACLQHDLECYRQRVEAFGCHAIVVDGHNIPELLEAFETARTIKGKPVALIMKTYKGHDFLDVENKENWHGKPLGSNAAKTIEHLEKTLMVPSTLGKLKPQEPLIDCEELHLLGTLKLPTPPPYKKGDKIATREAYGKALARLGTTYPRVIGLDGDTKNSTFSIYLRDARPEQFIECFIAEQNLVGVAIGCATRQRTVPFVSTFAAFLSRAYDQIRMGAISQTNCNFAGSHVGVSIGEDGASQMGLEDLAMFRAIQGSTVFYPSDGVSCERAVELAANTEGICFIRTGRPAVPVIYDANEEFAIGKAKICETAQPNGEDHVTVVGAGVTLFEALKAAEVLKAEGINLHVIDPFTIKPLDADLIASSVKHTHGRLITVEDHAPEGGLSEAVAAALGEKGVNFKQRVLAIHEVPHSGKPDELLAKYRINAKAICEEARALMRA